MKLKTLKDMDFEANELPEGDKVKVATSHQLKQEAIKWIKYMNKIYKKGIKECKGICGDMKSDVWCYPETIDWIKNFFNISEEELQ